MSKAKPIDRVEYTKNRSIIYVHPPVPVQEVEAVWDEEQGAVVQVGPGVDACPVCGAKIIHESGCVRCTCGWSRC